MVLVESISVGDIKKQAFTHTSFWVQIHNMFIMCMDKEIVQEIGGRIGKIEEVETNKTRECIGSFDRIKILVDITQLLMKKLLFKLDDCGKFQ